MYDRFKELGIPVTLTRDTDITLSPTERVNKIIESYGDTPNVLVISNHINAGGGDGAEVIYALRNSSRLSDLILEELKQAGQNPRKVYQRVLPSDPSKDYYFIHRETGNTEPVIVEYGFLDSPKDDVNQLKNNYQNLSEAVVRAVSEYINVEYVTPPTETYVVQSGDTLWSISKKFNIPVNTIKEYNDLTSNLLNINQILKIPSSVQQNNIYIIQPGDTLYKIANKYNTTVNAIKDYNNLTTNNLSINQQLKIPSSNIQEEIIETTYETYTVKSGDTLYKIANEYNTTVNKLKEINNLTTNALSINQNLLVPRTQEILETSIQDFREYQVKPGDTLYKIALENNTLIDNIKRINNLTTLDIVVGSILKIPYQTTTMYTVKPGDTLYKISKVYNTTTDSIKQKNNLPNDQLSIGQTLII